MNRRDFLGAAGCGMASLTGAKSLAQAVGIAGQKRPNILFIMSDDHARNAVSCYGGILSSVFQTPNIDRIANEGVRLDNCFVTNSICSPSRAVILTGKYSHLNGQAVNYIKFDGSQQTVPKLLQQAGYQTAMIGKWHLRGEPTGFDYWNILPAQGRYINPQFMEMELIPKTREGYVTTITTDIAIDWLENKRDKTRPFFMMCHNKAPHEAWEMDPADEGMFDGVEFPEPETIYDDYKNRATQVLKDKGLTVYPTLGKKMADKWPERRALDLTGVTDKQEAISKSYQHFMKYYLGSIHSVDKNVGRLLDYLEQEGLLDDTLVMYTSDNGMFLGEHSWYDKRMMYEESIEVPLIARYPKEIKPGTVSDAICLNLDFPETFLDYAGVPVPPDMQGRSLRPVLGRQEPADWRESMFYAYYEHTSQYGVRTKRYKLICYSAGEYDMFDLQKDPMELKSVYNDPEYADVRRNLEAEIVKLRKQYHIQDQDLPGNWEELHQDLLNPSPEEKKEYH
ncbi:MAG: sulfatase [Kiritimatiellales bacterium]